jgi:hypothetical protein
MAIVVYSNRRGTTMDMYREGTRAVRERGEYPRPEMLFLAAYGDPDDVQLFVVWESREAFDRFLREDMPAAEEGAGIDAGNLEIYELQDFVVSSRVAPTA